MKIDTVSLHRILLKNWPISFALENILNKRRSQNLKASNPRSCGPKPVANDSQLYSHRNPSLRRNICVMFSLVFYTIHLGSTLHRELVQIWQISQAIHKFLLHMEDYILVGLGFACMVGLEFVELGVVDPDMVRSSSFDEFTLFDPEGDKLR